jgi:hypothetical protein
VASGVGGRRLTVREGGWDAGGRWVGVDGAGGQLGKLDGQRFLEAEEMLLRRRF